jgi:hypothetical protein
MADEARPLSDDERAELEALRAEKAARLQREQDARERAELEALRAEQKAQRPQPQRQQQASRSQQEAEEDRRIREQRERGAKLMEPDDDLRMPLGQKIVLGVIAVVVVLIIVLTKLVGLPV